ALRLPAPRSSLDERELPFSFCLSRGPVTHFGVIVLDAANPDGVFGASRWVRRVCAHGVHGIDPLLGRSNKLCLRHGRWLGNLVVLALRSLKSQRDQRVVLQMR